MSWVLLQLYECPCSGDVGRLLPLLSVFVMAVLGAGWISRRFGKKGDVSMNATWKVIAVVALIGAVGVVFALKPREKAGERNVPAATTTAAASDAGEETASVDKQALPRLVDVGAGTCIPCKMMMPVLDQLRVQYAARLRVEYHDIREEPNAVQEYRIMVIPTQVLYDASGKEVVRHEGFWPQDEIEKKLAEMGIQ